MPIKNALSSLDIYVSCVIQWKNIGNKLFINTESLWMRKNKKTTNDDVKYTAPLQDPTFTTVVWLLLRAAWFGSKKVVQLYNQESLCKQRIYCIVLYQLTWITVTKGFHWMYLCRGGRQPSPGFIPRLFRLVAPHQGPYRASPGLARLARVGALIF